MKVPSNIVIDLGDPGSEELLQNAREAARAFLVTSAERCVVSWMLALLRAVGELAEDGAGAEEAKAVLRASYELLHAYLTLIDIKTDPPI